MIRIPFLAFVSAVALLIVPGLPAVCGSAASLDAQSRSLGESLSLGLRVGANVARHVDAAESWPSDIISSRRVGPVAGIAATLAVRWGMDLHAEILYSEKGSKRGDGSWVRLAYIEMPVMVRYPLRGARLPAEPFVGAGIAPAREASCSGEVRPPPQSQGAVEPLEPLDCSTARSYLGDLGVVVAGGAAFDLLGYDATAELRYTRGTSNLVRHLDHRSRQNRAVSLILGIRLPLDWG